MESLIILTLAAACVLYVSYSTIRLRRILFLDPFHPRLVYRFLILYAMVFSAFSADNTEAFDFITKLTILFAALFFLICLDLVAVIGPRFVVRELVLEAEDRDAFFAKAFLVLYFIGWAWRIFALQAGLLYGTFLATQLEVNSYGNLIGQLNGLSLLALMGRIIFVHSDRLTKGMLVLVIAEIGWAFMSGSKIAILYVIFPLLLVAYRRSWLHLSLRRMMITGFLGLLAVQLSFGIVTAYRNGVQQSVANGDQLAIPSLIEGVSASIQSIFDSSQINTSETSSGVGDRLNWAGFFGALIERPDLWNDLWWGESYYPIFSWWIPRFMWSDKPTVSVGAWYGEKVLGWDYGSRSEGAITIWGDGLMNFGFCGIGLASLLWLFFVYFIYQRIGAQGKWGLLVLSTVYVKLLLGLEQNLATPLVAFQLQIVVILFIRVFFSAFTSLMTRRVFP